MVVVVEVVEEGASVAYVDAQNLTRTPQRHEPLLPAGHALIIPNKQLPSIKPMRTKGEVALTIMHAV